MGIISAIGPAWRTWRGGRLDSYIRLDLTLYPGSTGGLVVNVAGEAIGIATPALSRIAGVAIPAPNIDRAVEEILKRGRVSRGYLGVGLQPVEISDHQKGLIILSVESGGPAAKRPLPPFSSSRSDASMGPCQVQTPQPSAIADRRRAFGVRSSGEPRRTRPAGRRAST